MSVGEYKTVEDVIWDLNIMIVEAPIPNHITMILANVVGELSKIKDTDLTHDRMEAIARKVIDTWDMSTTIEFAVAKLFDDYQGDCDQAVSDANDLQLTLEELDNE